jgi:tetratricopeptide (TPR) repeat protein
MNRLLAAACAVALSASAAWAQDVRVTLTDGSTVDGHLQGYVNGSYRLLVKGAVRDIEERMVVDLASAGARTGRSLTAADEALTALERGDHASALRLISSALDEMERPRRELTELANRIYFAYIETLLENRDGPRLAEILGRIPAALPREGRRQLFVQLGERYAELLRSASNDPFTVSFAEILARLAEEATLAEQVKTVLSALFVQLGDRNFDQKTFATAMIFYRATLKIDLGRREGLAPRMVEAAIAAAKSQLESGDARTAMESAREALSLDSASADARRLFEDAEFAVVKKDVEASLTADAEAILREFLAFSRRPEHRAWAEEELRKTGARPDPREPRAVVQMRKYFPVKAGRYVVYQRADGEARQKVRTQSVVREDDRIRVGYLIEETDRGLATRRPLELEVEKESVIMDTGSGRDTLLRFPARPGDAWTWKSRTHEFRRTVRSVGEAATIGPPGNRQTYPDCLVVDFTSTVVRDGKPHATTSRSTYAAGVGLVKLEYLDPAHRKFGLELVDLGTE